MKLQISVIAAMLLGTACAFGQPAVIFQGSPAAAASGGGGGNGLLVSLAGVYEMDQADNSDAPDATAGAHTLTRHGPTAVSGTKIEGTGSNHGATTPGYWDISGTLFNTNGTQSWYGWINTPNDGDFILQIGNGGSGSAKSLALYFDGTGALAGGSQHVKLAIRNGAGNAYYLASSTITISSAGWHMVAWTFDSGSNVGKLSVDNEALVSTGTTDGLDASTQNYRLGLGACLIDENAFWNNKVLSAGDISTLYNSGSGFFYSGGAWAN